MIRAAKHRRVVVFVASLGAGGTERVAVRVCGWLRDAGHDVCLLTLSGSDNDFHLCPEEVERVALDLQHPSRGLLHGFWMNFRRMCDLRSAVTARSAEVVITLGGESNVLMLLALIGVRCRKIISERCDPILGPLSRGWSLLRHLAYPMASVHVSQSHFVSEWLHRRFPKLPCIVIGNTAGSQPADCGRTRASVCEQSRPLRFIAVGRLTRAKGIDLLLSAFATVRMGSSEPIELHIVGDGEDREMLMAQADALGLNMSVSFVGQVADPSEKLKASDVYVLPSRHEGFPNAMVEAMAVGLPVIAARCQGGVEDVLGDMPSLYALEFLPGDVAALSEAMVLMASSSELRNRLAIAARSRAADYSPEGVSASWCRIAEGA